MMDALGSKRAHSFTSRRLRRLLRREGSAMASQSDELKLHLESVMDARPSRVFVALTDPDQLPRWWG